MQGGVGWVDITLRYISYMFSAKYIVSQSQKMEGENLNENQKAGIYVQGLNDWICVSYILYSVSFFVSPLSCILSILYPVSSRSCILCPLYILTIVSKFNLKTQFENSICAGSANYCYTLSPHKKMTQAIKSSQTGLFANLVARILTFKLQLRRNLFGIIKTILKLNLVIFHILKTHICP